MQEVKIIDLFSGAGGITCGFEGTIDKINFKTVLGLDIDPSAISIYNDNFGTRAPNAKVNIGRKVDLNWFAHASEIRLFYLVHLALTGADDPLLAQLNALNVDDFLLSIQQCDRDFSERFATLADGPKYKSAINGSMRGSTSTALVKNLMGKLGLTSLVSPRPALGHLPWSEEYQHARGRRPLSAPDIDAEISKSMQELWDTQVQSLLDASEKTGRGKLKDNASKVSDVVAFLRSPQGAALGQLWVQWRATRETIRASYCVEHREQIDELYTGGRRVNVILGGPPCKGFSRIGRPVIQSLRDQGVHAWSHREYGDERNALMCQYVLFLGALGPDVFLFENVANFQSALKTPNGVLDAPSMLAELIDAISDSAHYAVKHKVLNARQFGVPQDRRRFIMFGVRREGRTDAEKEVTSFFDLPVFKDDVPLAVALDGLAAAHPFDSSARHEGRVNVYHKIDERMPKAELSYRRWVHAPNPLTGEIPLTTTGHIYRLGRDDDRAFIEYVAPGIRWMDLKPSKSPTLKKAREILRNLQEKSKKMSVSDELSWLETIVDDSIVLRLLLEHNQIAKGLDEQHLLLEGYLKNGATQHGDWFERLSASKPCKTIVAHIGKDTYGYWHPFERRSITIREAARVQSFPDWFKISGVGVVDAYTAIGNAVPPLMARAFAEQLVKLHIANGMFHLSNSGQRLAAAE
ncbi:DNA cytosine methyltransferase [Shinella fusca]|uniref:DNA (cytosine-5-)-methyltransferase n=1 Tax=Shinella fusca TaxID=544480 RepID=A0A7W8DUI9_9HYPH|nr:DNA (cytosine-5-)-methyltransferase [Shinella fusca]MBB5042632.1 DNA-cytosine methyltransferase [Shinella fusca]